MKKHNLLEDNGKIKLIKVKQEDLQGKHRTFPAQKIFQDEQEPLIAFIDKNDKEEKYGTFSNYEPTMDNILDYTINRVKEKRESSLNPTSDYLGIVREKSAPHHIELKGKPRSSLYI